MDRSSGHKQNSEWVNVLKVEMCRIVQMKKEKNIKLWIADLRKSYRIQKSTWAIAVVLETSLATASIKWVDL